MAAIKLFLISLVLFFSISPCLAEDYSVAQGCIHSFDNNITVYTGVFALNKDVSLNTSAYFRYTVDMINPSFGEAGGGEGNELDKRKVSRSLAAISGASTTASGGRTTLDTRNEITFGFSHNFENAIGVDAYYNYSQEKDYISNTPSVTFKKELFEKNTTLVLGYSRNIDTIDGSFMTSSDRKNTDNYYAGITQIITPVTITQFGYSKNVSSGYMPEGNRLVPVDGVASSSCTDKSTSCLEESFPDNRARKAYLFGVNHYLTRGMIGFTDPASLRLSLRYYKDDWDISSFTEEVEYYQYMSNLVLMRLTLRNYNQTAAYFVKKSYTSSDQFLSASPQHEGFNTKLIGFKLSYSLKDSPDAGFLKNGFIEGGYEYYTQSIGVNAHNIMIELRVPF